MNETGVRNPGIREYFSSGAGWGPGSDPEESDPLARDEPWLGKLYAASVSGRAAFGAKAGRYATRTGDRIDRETVDALASPRCASVAGFSLHAIRSPFIRHPPVRLQQRTCWQAL
jgi:hypothetical protein